MYLKQNMLANTRGSNTPGSNIHGPNTRGSNIHRSKLRYLHMKPKSLVT